MQHHTACLVFSCLAVSTSLGLAQETDITQTPNAVGAGIQKSYTEQVGAGRGDRMTPGSSLFLIGRDPARSIVRGRQLFQRKFTGAQGLGPRLGDGMGNLSLNAAHGAGLADSCAACHGRPQGSAGFGGDVFTRPSSRDAPHLFGLGLQEMLADEMTSELRAIRDRAIADALQKGKGVSWPLKAKGLSFGVLHVREDGTLKTQDVRGVDSDLRIKPFFAEGSTISIREFAVGAFSAEMGLQSSDPDLIAAAAGADVTTPSGMVLTGSEDAIEAPPISGPTVDGDGDGVVEEVPESIVDHMEFYLLNYFKPGTRVSPAAEPAVNAGMSTFDAIGCTACHVPSLQIERDRRVADFETSFDATNGNPLNSLYAVPSLLFNVVDDGSGFPALKQPAGAPFQVNGIYTDFRRHDLGPNFWELQFDGSIVKNFMTEPLWGVGSTAPYGHDGRSNTLEDAILRHGGEAQGSRDLFAGLTPEAQSNVTTFLRSLVLFSPPSTASPTDPALPLAPLFPMVNHGSIKLGVLFNDPADRE